MCFGVDNVLVPNYEKYINQFFQSAILRNQKKYDGRIEAMFAGFNLHIFFQLFISGQENYLKNAVWVVPQWVFTYSWYPAIFRGIIKQIEQTTPLRTGKLKKSKHS